MHNHRRRTLSKAAYFILIAFCSSTISHVHAAAYRPASDQQIIDTLPAGSPTYQQLSKQSPTARQPFSKVEPQISALLKQSYASGDPRALGLAESLLEPYATDHSAPVRLIRANIYQASHRFNQARQELQAVLKQLPNQPDSVLMLSSIDLVQGRFTEARQYCQQITDMGLLVLRLSCIAQVDSMTGKLQESANTLKQLLQLNNGLTSEQQRWLNLMLADIALRLDDPILAKQVFEQLDQHTAPSLMARADWLMAHQAWQQTRKLLIKHTDNDSLLLRLVISEQHLNDPAATAHFKLLAERIRIWNERGETAHQREEAQYALLFNPTKALTLARLNWQKQRETADVVVYANAALRANSQSDIKIIQAWIKQSGFEYPRLVQALAKGARAS